MLEITTGLLTVKVDPATKTVQLNGLRCSDDCIADMVARMAAGEPFVIRVTPRTVDGFVAPVFEELKEPFA